MCSEKNEQQISVALDSEVLVTDKPDKVSEIISSGNKYAGSSGYV